jgi:hypothetical protein
MTQCLFMGLILAPKIQITAHNMDTIGYADGNNQHHGQDNQRAGGNGQPAQTTQYKYD